MISTIQYKSQGSLAFAGRQFSTLAEIFLRFDYNSGIQRVLLFKSITQILAGAFWLLLFGLI